MNDKQRARTGDDFKRIKGIGPATERRLHNAGILTYTQLAASTPDQLVALLDGLVGMSAERVVQENWAGHATALAQQETAVPGNGHHYASFTVELLLDQQNEVRRTRVVHVQQEQHKASWAGWQASKVTAFISKHAELKVAEDGNRGETAVVAAPKPTPQPAKPVTPPKSKATTRRTHGLLDLVDDRRMVFAQSFPPTPHQKSQRTAAAGNGRGNGNEKRPLTIHSPRILLAHTHPLDVNLNVNPTLLPASQAGPFSYRVAVFAEQVNSSERQQVGTSQGAGTSDNPFTITVPIQIHRPGTYRLQAEMSVLWRSATADTTTGVKGDLLHIY